MREEIPNRSEQTLETEARGNTKATTEQIKLELEKRQNRLIGPVE